MNADALRETVPVVLPRWRFGPWRWGPLVTARLVVSYHPTHGFTIVVEGLNVPDRARRFFSLLVPIRHELLKRYQSMESITRQHRRHPPAPPAPVDLPGAPSPPVRPAAAPAPAGQQQTGIFRMPKQDISTRITRLREKRPPQPPQVETPPWISAHGLRSSFLVE
jgi:hypothetical protein